MKSLRPYNTFGFDVSARDIVLMHGIEDYLRCVRDSGPRLILGGGSDVLLSEDFPGTVYVMASRGITVERKTADYAVVRFAAGESWKETVEWCLGCGLSGIENLALIPGTCGAAPVQNIGAYGREFADICEYVEIMHEDGTCERLPPEKCGFSYRMSRFKSDLSGCLITAVGLRLSRSFVPHIGYKALQCLGEKRDLSALDVYDKILELRGDRLPDPARIGNAGCFGSSTRPGSRASSMSARLSGRSRPWCSSTGAGRGRRRCWILPGLSPTGCASATGSSCSLR